MKFYQKLFKEFTNKYKHNIYLTNFNNYFGRTYYEQSNYQ